MTLKLHKEIYRRDVVERAIDDYRELATIVLTVETDYWVCFFEASIASTATTVREFENYLIALSALRRL
ncbi:MAG: HxsD-like protein [Thermoguttaceae bacterium]|nr:HxsD-like protein [Thermoguttaceae bacterium]